MDTTRTRPPRTHYDYRYAPHQLDILVKAADKWWELGRDTPISGDDMARLKRVYR